MKEEEKHINEAPPVERFYQAAAIASLFLKVKPGYCVLIGENKIAKVFTFIGVSRDPDASSLFQAVNVDTGKIKWVHAAEVKEIVSTF